MALFLRLLCCGVVHSGLEWLFIEEKRLLSVNIYRLIPTNDWKNQLMSVRREKNVCYLLKEIFGRRQTDVMLRKFLID